MEFVAETLIDAGGTTFLKININIVVGVFLG
jgi:hypothetical protein